jgi:predicted rRNA methylase YqxC with S4 and FtsJ domains
MPGERTDEEKALTRDAQMARAKLRRGKMLELVQQKLEQSEEAKRKGWRKAVLALSLQQQKIVEDYRSGELLRQANNLTILSGHGRLKKEDGSYQDIGGSTGGFVRIVLDDWEPPDVEAFEGYKSYVW